MSDSTKQSGPATSISFERPRPRRSGVEDTTDNKSETETTEKNKRESNSGDTELPPNENLRKDADEAYGDTEIPERKGDL
jgi:hypothetical protein